jgi:hypothetical protein
MFGVWSPRRRYQAGLGIEKVSEARRGVSDYFSSAIETPELTRSFAAERQRKDQEGPAVGQVGRSAWPMVAILKY